MQQFISSYVLANGQRFLVADDLCSGTDLHLAVPVFVHNFRPNGVLPAFDQFGSFMNNVMLENQH